MRLKKAFTLGEALIVFIIIGIIAAIGMSTVKPWQKSYKYAYSRMYNALSLTIYNYMINTIDEDAFPKNDEALCKAFLQFINTADNATTCKGGNIGKNPTSFPENKIRMVASNGNRIWIGANNDGSPFILSQPVDATTTDVVRYFLVFVDINGNRGPNSPEWKPNRMADIVAFVLTDKFKVLPIGYPEVDGRYLSAHVVYPTLNAEYSDGDADSARITGDEEVVSDPMTYYEAKVKAFGYTISAGDLDTYNFRDIFPNGSYFKVDNYNNYYPSSPAFDVAMCAYEGTVPEPICSVKIFDYH